MLLKLIKVNNIVKCPITKEEVVVENECVKNCGYFHKYKYDIQINGGHLLGIECEFETKKGNK